MLKAWEYSATPCRDQGPCFYYSIISRLFFEISLVIVFYGTLLNHKSQMEIIVAYAFFFLLFLVRRVQEKSLYENTVDKTHFHYYINIQNLRFSSKPFSGRVQ